MNKIVKSLVMLMVIVIGVGSASQAYFSDTETSEANTFVAGQIDLEVGFTSTYNGNADQSWGILDSISNELFFDFNDVKPEDEGEGTVQVRVTDNPSWMCANITLTASNENNRNDAEVDANDLTTGLWGGELDEEIAFFFWVDDNGDGFYNTADGDTSLTGGVPLYASDLDQTGAGDTFDLVDSTTNLFDAGAVGTPFPALATQDIELAWCFGDMTIPNDGTAITCDGSAVGNESQSDNLIGDISFYAIQSRHNDTFECSEWDPNLIP